MTISSLPRLTVLLCLAATGLLLWPQQAKATVSCSATMSSLNFGAFNPTQSGTATTQGNVSFSCQNDSFQKAYVAACLNIGSGNGSSTTPRNMSSGSNTLNFQLYKDAATSQIWGSTTTPATPSPVQLQFTVPAYSFFGGNGQYQSPNYPVHSLLPGNQPNAGIGNYSNNFSGADAFLSGQALNGGPYPASCGNAASGIPFPFTVSAQVLAACTVTATDMNFGSPASSAINIPGTSTITVTCVKGTAYSVGLAPSNGATNGQGMMAGAAPGNSDQVPYRLCQNNACSQAWGNTIGTNTLTAANGLAAGTGTGQQYVVHGLVPSANYRPDSYDDTVTVYVTY